MKNSSLPGARKKLSQKKLINDTPHEEITMTPKEEKLAKKIAGRYHTPQEFLITVLGVKEP